MKKLNIISTLAIIGFVITFLLTLDAAFGSYQESEPHAGNILFVASAVILVIGGLLYMKFKPRIFKEA